LGEDQALVRWGEEGVVGEEEAADDEEGDEEGFHWARRVAKGGEAQRGR
jgi:hypothetical protein